MRPGRLGGLLVAVLLSATGCSGGDGGDGTSAAPNGATGATTAAAAPKAPRVGSCYQLDVRSALKATSSRPAVSCSHRHTAVTVAVGTVQPVVDGHLLALDSTLVQRQIADRCRRAVDAHVGGSLRDQRLSRIQAVWFNPTTAQADRGALWYRCDLVISSGPRTFAALPRKTHGMLRAQGAMSRWGTCGTASPAAKHFQRVLCSARHTWRARAATTLPAGTAYLSTKAGRTADARCRAVAAKLSPKSSKLRWAFEWPTRDQWQSGQRYGLCWTPDA
ncbi:septum formation family protein [Nocardioides marmorisolisilvae]|nr:septum formation family protein [Nocardioides marmorisolisilvae]